MNDVRIGLTAKELQKRLVEVRDVQNGIALEAGRRGHQMIVPSIDEDTRRVALQLFRLAQEAKAETPWLKLFLQDPDAFDASIEPHGNIERPVFGDLLHEIEPFIPAS